MARKRKKRKASNFERVGNWISLILVLGAIGAAGFVWWRWVSREERFDKLMVEVGLKYGVDPCLVKAVVRRESKFDPWVYGSHGEIGLMQVTEGAGAAWARAVGRRIAVNDNGVSSNSVHTSSVALGFGRDMLWDPRVNLEAGTWYLGRAMGRWRGRGEEVRVALGLAEYNAGLGNVLRWVPREGAGGAGGVEAGGIIKGKELGNGAVGVAGSGGDGGKGLMGNAGVVGGGDGELTAEELVGGITYPAVRDYVREVMESWRIYRERGM